MGLDKQFEKKSLRSLILHQQVQVDRDAEYISDLQREIASLRSREVHAEDAQWRAIRHASHGRAVAGKALDLPWYRICGRRKALAECCRLFTLIEKNEM